MIWAIIPAAGRGSRLPGAVPKQYRKLGSRTILDQCLSGFLSRPEIQGLIVALAADDAHWPQSEFAKHPKVHTCVGGDERADSVLAALRALREHGLPADTPVLVHDAARALLPQDALLRLLAEPPGADGAILAIPAQDSLKRSAGGQRIDGSVDRSQIWLAQTPQYFELERLHDALTAALAQGLMLTDEASYMELRGHKPRLVMGDALNFKITTAADLSIAKALMEQV